MNAPGEGPTTSREHGGAARMDRELPAQPDFGALYAAAPQTADRRTRILALIGNLVFGWSNNESVLVYVLMLLLETDKMSAAIVFATLNTTRARLDLIQRLARAKIADREMRDAVDRLLERFARCTRERNEFNHCMYAVNQRGEITHTQTLRVRETRSGIRMGETRPLDDARIAEMTAALDDLKALNRALWEILPRLEAFLARRRAARDVS